MSDWLYNLPVIWLATVVFFAAYCNLVKWLCLEAQAVCILLVIAMVHIDDRRSGAVAMGIFSTAVAVSVLLIPAHNRPFAREISVGPEPLLKVLPQGENG